MNCLGGLVVYERYIIFWSSLFMRYENSWNFFARALRTRAFVVELRSERAWHGNLIQIDGSLQNWCIFGKFRWKSLDFDEISLKISLFSWKLTEGKSILKVPIDLHQMAMPSTFVMEPCSCCCSWWVRKFSLGYVRKTGLTCAVGTYERNSYIPCWSYELWKIMKEKL